MNLKEKISDWLIEYDAMSEFDHLQRVALGSGTFLNI